MTTAPSAPTVLLVDDAAELAQVVARELESSGYRVLRASDGRTALELHARARPDLVVLDWMLPGLDGLEVLRRVRQASGPGAATPVLMLTARGEEADRVLGLELGADDYLTKPFSNRELLARVRALLRREELLRQRLAADREGDQAPLAYGPLALDPERHTATLDGRPLDLTPNEFGLLRLLLRGPGRAFSRSYLLDTLWGEAYVGGDRSVDNTVLRLRKKLGPLGDAIETVWGVGYRLRPLDAGAAAPAAAGPPQQGESPPQRSPGES
ncbi:MAG TPA: response regulator transcription factor [Chloroflexota bacterium]|jgi:DNA-binding response OmpR family regulator|nr:response regulator transcription factor [Chloroflexota bacterium]